MNEGDYIRGYRLKQEIGRGSYGDVWLAEKQMDFGGASVFYALKILRNRNGEGVDIEKVIKEIVAWTKASSHSNVISIRDSFTDHGKYVIVSDYADGGSLKNRQFAMEEAARIIEGVLDGIEYLHRLPIIHRDIKPENILLKNGVPCISDFGLAREFDKTQSTGLAGSINYFSPEMAKKELGYEAHERNPLDDLWATAVTFYQLITGELPFKKMGHIIKCERAPLPENLATELVGFFDKAFHRKRSRRFQSAREMRKALQEAVYPEDSYENKIEELALQLSDLQFKILESQNNANLLYKMVAEERIKFQRLSAAKQEIEKQSSAERENVRKLQSQVDVLHDELQNLRQQTAETTAENEKLKKRLAVWKTRSAQPHPEKNGVFANNLLPFRLEQPFIDAGEDFLNQRAYDQAIAQFTEAIELNSENANAYYKRGSAYNGRGTVLGNTEDYDRAIRDYYQATFLIGKHERAFRAPHEAPAGNQGVYVKSLNGTRQYSFKDCQREFVLNPIFNDAYNVFENARRERRREILRSTLRWFAMILAFTGLYISTSQYTRPLAADAATYLRRQLYDSGKSGEAALFSIFMTACAALSVFFVIWLAVYLKKVLRSRIPERIIFTTSTGVG